MPVAILGLSGLLAVVWFTLPRGTSTESDALCRAVLAENWKGVIDLCASEEDTPMPVHLRALKGHACLALNRNDESLGHFLSIVNDGDRLAWKEWALQFAETNPQNAVAAYLKGDALARIANWEDALACYVYALGTARSDHLKAMILSARGVAYAHLDNSERAMADLERANVVAPGFADAHANLGTLLLLGEAADGALTKYDEAVDHSDSFTLVRVGKTCAMLGQSRDQDTLTKAIKEFSSLASYPHVAALAEENLESLARTMKEAGESEIAVAKGMSLSANEFREMDTATRTGIMRNMTYSQLDNIVSKSYKNYAHSRSWGESLDYIEPIRNKIPFFSSTQSHRHADQHLEVFNEARGIMQENYNVDQASHFRDSGGADTEGVALYKSRGDTGPWPAKKTWFGLMPAIGLPQVTIAGTES